MRRPATFIRTYTDTVMSHVILQVLASSLYPVWNRSWHLRLPTKRCLKRSVFILSDPQRLLSWFIFIWIFSLVPEGIVFIETTTRRWEPRCCITITQIFSFVKVGHVALLIWRRVQVSDWRHTLLLLPSRLWLSRFQKGDIFL